jgi:hypothetical protein
MTQDTTNPVSWPNAYKAFLLDKNESTLLKLAPLAIIFGAPEVIVSNIIPVVGEFVDIGGLSLASIIAARTFLADRKHR